MYQREINPKLHFFEFFINYSFKDLIMQRKKFSLSRNFFPAIKKWLNPKFSLFLRFTCILTLFSQVYCLFCC